MQLDDMLKIGGLGLHTDWETLGPFLLPISRIPAVMFVYCLFPSYSAERPWYDLTSPILTDVAPFLFWATKGVTADSCRSCSSPPGWWLFWLVPGMQWLLSILSDGLPSSSLPLTGDWMDSSLEMIFLQKILKLIFVYTFPVRITIVSYLRLV